MESDCLWRKVLVSKYMLDSRSLIFQDIAARRVAWSPLLQDIVSVLKLDSLLSRGLKEGILCKVGNGRHISFWKDPWEDSIPLMTKFPRIFAICSNKTETLANLGYISHGRWKWDLAFRRAFFGWETQILSDFHKAIENCFPCLGKNDGLIWSMDCSGVSLLSLSTGGLKKKLSQIATLVLQQNPGILFPRRLISFSGKCAKTNWQHNRMC